MATVEAAAARARHGRDDGPTAFSSVAQLRRWFASNHDSADVIVMRLMRKHAAHRGIMYADALNEALCFGWIDGVRRAFDADSFTVRFTPRRPRSIWSLVNIRHVKRLRDSGRMMPAGEKAFAARTTARSGVYSFEQRRTDLPPAYLKRIQANKRAWIFFASQPPGYRRASVFWVMSARQDATRERRLAQLMADSRIGLRIAILRR
jgi:uncharacterized protein YdeI (YjbR/CyaY-like superfamily)